eukprot:TRINITY_DN14911_c0_g1_i1.p1 TRINITY_DN14911_c0_g1~~TRINITY_DN14911_c0_g1_i1.p1  ORF type:complete len:2630 (+),score=799.92 TRINITY_DN14911_c0_g1_i1:112-8001(+)
MSEGTDVLVEAERIMAKDKEKEAEVILAELIRASTNDSFAELPRETTTSAPSTREQSLYLDQELCETLAKFPHAERDNFVQYFLTAIGHNRGSHADVIKEASLWINANKANETERTAAHATDLKIRFSDGIDHAKSLEGLNKVDFWDTTYIPDCSVREMAQNLERWNTPKGFCWSKEEVADVIAIQSIIEANETAHIPIHIYTSAMYRKILWAVWVPSQDRWSEMKYHADLEKDFDQLNRLLDIKSKKALREIAANYKVKMEHVDPSPKAIKDRFYNLDGFEGKLATGDPYYLIRSTDEYDSIAPIKNSVAWVSRPEVYFKDSIFGIDAYMPPPRVFEYLESRPRSQPTSRTTWKCYPVGTDEGDSIIQDCYAEPNQSRYNEALHHRFIKLLDNTPSSGPTAPLRLIMNEKLKDCGQKPTPQDIAHAIELQELQWTNNGKTRTFIVGLSGFPRLIVDKVEPYACTNLFRVYHECIEQPYHLLNATMRNVQSNNNSVYLEIRSSKYRGTYMCDERNMGTGQPVPMYQQRTRHRVMWKENETWCITHSTGKQEYHVDYEDAKLKIGDWMLDDVRPLMWYLERALDIIPPEPEGVKSYRGLADVTLARDIYCPGGLVMWGAYSSSSADQATATWFAMQEGSAAVFTLRGRSCKKIADYSRFAREMEYLYPPNICFQVKTMLTEDQQQILGREGLQLYELDEVDDLEALSIYITQNINAAITGQGMGLVNQLVSVIQSLVNKELLDALEHAVTPSKPLLQKEHGMEIAKRLKVLAEQNASPLDPEGDGVTAVLNDGLINAARDGHAEAVERLIELGANPDEKCKDGWHPVEHALIGGHLNVTQLLLKHTNFGTESDFVTRTDSNGNTPLHRMAEAGHEKAIILLLRIGADPLARNKQNLAPAELAFAAKHTELVHLLKPSQVLGEAEMQKMRKYWRKTHYTADDRRFRFTEPVGGGSVTYGVRTIGQAFDVKKGPSEDCFKVAEGLKLWRTPKGEAWEGEAVTDLVNDARTTIQRKEGTPWKNAVPLFIHTASIYHTTVWAVWVAQPERVIDGWWKVIETAPYLLEEAFNEDSESITLTPPAAAAIARTLSKAPDEIPSMFTLVNKKPRRGLYGYTAPCGGGKQMTMFRFRASDVSARSFSSCVAWVPAPELAFLNEDSLPLFSVLENIYSRAANETLKGHKDGGKNWECHLAPLKDLPDLVRTRLSAHNPQSSDESDAAFYKEVERRIESFNNNLLTQTFKAKVRARNSHTDDVVPTLEMVSQALDLQLLTFKDGGPSFMLALTGPKKVIVYETTRGGVTEIVVTDIHRVCRHMGHTPSEYMDITAANIVKDRTDVKIDIPKGEFAGVYNHVNPGDEESTYNQSRRRRKAKGEGVRVTASSGALNGTQSCSGSLVRSSGSMNPVMPGSGDFDAEADEFKRAETPVLTARWSRKKDCWIVQTNTSRHAVAHDDVALHLGTFMSPYIQPLLSAVQAALDDMMISHRAPPLYRASLNPNLALDTAIIWGTVISASESYTLIESMFEADEQVAIFTLNCTSAKSISEFSRFGREVEWAIPPNCVFERKDSRLIEANDTRALSLFIQDKISQLSSKTTMGSDVRINQLLLAKQNLNQNNTNKSLEIILEPNDPERPLIEDDDGLLIARKLLECGAERHIVTRALHNAAREGYYKCIPHLMELGADVSVRDKEYGPVELAILGGHEEVIQHLREASKKPIKLPDVRSYAAAGEDLAVLLIYTLEKAAGKSESILKLDREGKYPIHLANENGRTYTVYLLRSLMAEMGKVLTEIESKYTMNMIDVLRQAIEEGQSKSAMALLKRLDEVTEKGGMKNCLHFAAQKFTGGHGIKVLKELTKKGQTLINSVDQYSWTPLRYAVDAGNTQGVDILLAAGANPYIPDKYGNPITCQAKTDGTIRARLHDYFEKRWVAASTIYKQHLRSDTKEKLEELASMFLQNADLFMEAKREYLFWKDDKGNINKVCYNFIANGPKGESFQELEARITKWLSKVENSIENIFANETMTRKELEDSCDEAFRNIKTNFEEELQYTEKRCRSVQRMGRKELIAIILHYVNPILLFTALGYVLLSVPYFLAAKQDISSMATVLDAVVYSLFFANFLDDFRSNPNTVEIDSATQTSPEKQGKDKDSDEQSNNEEESIGKAGMGVKLLWKVVKAVPWMPLRAFGTHPALRTNLLMGLVYYKKIWECPIVVTNVLQTGWVVFVTTYVVYLVALVQMTVGGGMCRGSDTPAEESDFWQCSFFTLRLFLGWDTHNRETVRDDAKVVASLLISVLGLASRVLIISAINHLVDTRDTRKKTYRDRVQQVTDVLTHAKPEVLQIAIDYYKLAWRKRGTVDLVQTGDVLTPLYPFLQNMVETATAIKVKEKIPLFKNITFDRLAKIIPCLKYMLAPKDVVFFYQGDESTHMYFLLSGKVIVRMSGMKEPPVLGKGDYFGEVGLVYKRCRNASVVAIEDCELYQIDEEAFAMLLTNKDVHSEIIKVANDRRTDPDPQLNHSTATPIPDDTTTYHLSNAPTGYLDTLHDAHDAYLAHAVVSTEIYPYAAPMPNAAPPRDAAVRDRRPAPPRNKSRRQLKARQTSHSMSISNPLRPPNSHDDPELTSHSSSVSLSAYDDEEVTPYTG